MLRLVVMDERCLFACCGVLQGSSKDSARLRGVCACRRFACGRHFVCSDCCLVCKLSIEIFLAVFGALQRLFGSKSGYQPLFLVILPDRRRFVRECYRSVFYLFV